MQFRIEIDAVFEADNVEHAHKFWEDYFRALSIEKKPKPVMGKVEIRELAKGEELGLIKSNVRYFPRKVKEE